MFFTSGLPRSGSTLLQNILNQNPTIHATPTSGLAGVLTQVRDQWHDNTNHRAIDQTQSKLQLQSVLGGILNSYHMTDKIVFDKSRMWPNRIEMLEWLIGDVKILVTVRDIRDILSSFEKLWRKNSPYRKLSQDDLVGSTTVSGRCDNWMLPGQPLGFALNAINDAIVRGHSSKMFLVRYEQLTTYPDAVLSSIYHWLNLPYYKHNFNAIEQTTHEDDTVHGIEGLHTIRNSIAPSNSDWEEILGEFARKYARFNL